MGCYEIFSTLVARLEPEGGGLHCLPYLRHCYSGPFKWWANFLLPSSPPTSKVTVTGNGTLAILTYPVLARQQVFQNIWSRSVPWWWSNPQTSILYNICNCLKLECRFNHALQVVSAHWSGCSGTYSCSVRRLSIQESIAESCVILKQECGEPWVTQKTQQVGIKFTQVHSSITSARLPAMLIVIWTNIIIPSISFRYIRIANLIRWIYPSRQVIWLNQKNISWPLQLLNIWDWADVYCVMLQPYEFNFFNPQSSNQLDLLHVNPTCCAFTLVIHEHVLYCYN